MTITTIATYTVQILDEHCDAGHTTIRAASLADAITDAIAWAQEGDWDHPGTVEIRISRHDELLHEQTIEVGQDPETVAAE